jgi:tetrahydromethanopterin S-methyltransferase subunit H
MDEETQVGIVQIEFINMLTCLLAAKFLNKSEVEDAVLATTDRCNKRGLSPTVIYETLNETKKEIDTIKEMIT